MCQATAAGDAIACIAFKGTIPIIRQQKDLVGGSRNCLVLLTYSTVFVLWVSGSEKVQNYVDVIYGWSFTCLTLRKRWNNHIFNFGNRDVSDLNWPKTENSSGPANFVRLFFSLKSVSILKISSLAGWNYIFLKHESELPLQSSDFLGHWSSCT